MSTLISRLPLATMLLPIDMFPVEQGDPPVTRMATLLMIQSANTLSVGQVGPRNRIGGPIHFSELQLATQVYLNDIMIVEEGMPGITRRATVASVMSAVSRGVFANSELKGSPVNQRISDLPLSP